MLFLLLTDLGWSFKVYYSLQPAEIIEKKREFIPENVVSFYHTQNLPVVSDYFE